MSIRKVLNRGHLMLTIPTMCFLFLLPFASYLVSSQFLGGNDSGIVVLVSILVGLVLGWLSWSYFVVKWKIYAFEEMDKSEWGELYNRAVAEKLIWEFGSIFERTEIRSKEEKEKLASIEDAFFSHTDTSVSLADLVIDDDGSLLEETRFFYKKTELYANAILPIVFGLAGGYLIWYAEELFFGIMGFVVVVLVFSPSKFVDLFERRVQLTLSDHGVNFHTLESVGFVKWENVEMVTTNSETASLYLSFWEGDVMFDVTLNISGYDFQSYPKLLETINIYMKRNFDQRTSLTQ